MKARCLLCLSGVLLSLGAANAATWILDTNPARPAHYRSLIQALDSPEVQNGDVLYLAPSSASYGNVNLSKSVSIIGPGYLLNQNLSFSSSTPSAVTGSIVFSGGSDGSLISGLEIRGDVQLNGANNLTIKRNLIQGQIYCTSTVPSHSLLILQNHVNGYITMSQGAANSGITIRGNFCGGKLLGQDPEDSLDVQNNIVIDDLVVVGDSYVANNMIRYDLYLGGNSLGENNWRRQLGASSGTEFNGRPWGGEPGTTFYDQFLGTGTLDARWQLKPDALVRGTGKNGTDPGAFGGTDPYVLSGLSALPLITGIEAPTSASAASGLPVSVTVEVNP